MDRVRTIQAKGGDHADYHTAYLQASRDLAAEDVASEQAAEGIEASRVSARAAHLLHLGKHFSDFGHCATEAGATVNPEGGVKTLTGVTGTTKGTTASYTSEMLFYIPPITSTEKITLLGYSAGIISAKELP